MDVEVGVKPDPFMGAGPLRVVFAEEHGLLALLADKGNVRRMLRHAEIDQRIKVGQWLRAGFANIGNTGAGKVVRDIFEAVDPHCGNDLSREIFDLSREQLLEMSDRDLGRIAKIYFNSLKRSPGVADNVAKRILSHCCE